MAHPDSLREPSMTPDHTPPRADPPVPRLSIAHLLLLAFTTSVMLALTSGDIKRSLQTPEDNADLTRQLGHGLVTLAHALLMGATLAGSAILLHRRWRAGKPLYVAPGHWILHIDSFGGLLLYLIGAVRSLFGGALYFYDDVQSFVWNALVAVLFAVCAGLWLWARSRLRQERAWLVYCAISSLRYGLAAVVVGSLPFFLTLSYNWISAIGVLSFVDPFLLVATIVTLLIAVARDRTQARPRDWLHWLGVAATLAEVVIYAIRFSLSFVSS